MPFRALPSRPLPHRRMPHRALALLIGLALAQAAAADDCSHRAERNLDLDASAITVLELRAGAGDLDIRGVEGLQQVEVRGVACATSEELLDGIRLSHSLDGERLLVGTTIPEVEDGGWFFSRYAYLDLSLRVPSRLLLEAQDSSGDFELRGVAGASIVDSSGDLEIEDIAGDLRVTDTSGDIEISRVGGNVHIPSDSSGDIEIDHVAGNVTVDSDSSGDIEIAKVRGDAHVERDSSGDIRFEDVDGNASVGSDSSGSIEAVRIGRDFSVEADSSGSINHNDVTGAVRLPAR